MQAIQCLNGSIGNERPQMKRPPDQTGSVRKDKNRRVLKLAMKIHRTLIPELVLSSGICASLVWIVLTVWYDSRS